MPRAQLSTARLTLRPVTAADEAAVVSAIDDIAVSGWLAVVPFPYTAADFHHFLTEIAKPGETFLVEDSQGFAGIVSGGRVLGFWFAPRCHGQGYATEAARAVLAAQLTDDPADVDSGYFEGNARSANVLRKLGFIEQGRGPNHCRALGIDRPHVDVRLTRVGFLNAWPREAVSARLGYRSLQPFDLPELHELVSDWSVVRQLGSFPWPPEQEFTATRAKPYDGDGFAWAVLRDGRLIGTVAVTKGELGYMISPGFWRKGFAAEATRTALDRAFQAPDLAQIVAHVWADNTASLGLLSKLGFVETRRYAEHSKARKVEAASVSLALDRADWLQARATA